MKLVHALRPSEPTALRDALLAPQLLAHLATAGVTRWQVNVEDDGIAAHALRLHTSEPPIRCVLSSWTDGDPDEVTDTLAGLLPSADPAPVGWVVEERVPMEPPAAPDGVRADALANIAFLRRPATMTEQDWLAHWHGPHTRIAMETQATFGYVQNVVRRGLTATTPAVDGIVEELFPTAAMSDLHAFYGSGGDDAELGRRIDRLMESVAIFGADRDLDLVPTGRYVVDLGGRVSCAGSGSGRT